MTSESTSSSPENDKVPEAANLERRLSDEEIRRVLRDAAELQAGQAATGGLTIRELRGVATEAGIDARFVDTAIAALTSSSGAPTQELDGGRHHWYRRRMTPGVVPLEHLDRILHVIRKTFGEDGTLDLVSGRLEWTGTSVVVGVTGRGSATEIDLTADESIPYGFTYAGLPVIGVVLGAILGGSVGASGIVLLVLLGLGGVAGHVAARSIWARYARSHEAKLEARLERVATEVAAQAR